jgi:hypothetical protein
MRTVILMLMFGTTTTLFAQIPHFEKLPIGDSGCFGYFPGDPQFETTFSEDSSKVYTGEVSTDSFNYFAICVKLSLVLNDAKEEQIGLLESYMDYLQQAFDITASAGYGEGHTLDGYPAVSGVIDYWTDIDGYQWAVKGWVNAQFLVVMGIYGSGEYPYFNAQQMYFNGIRFPEE